MSCKICMNPITQDDYEYYGNDYLCGKCCDSIRAAEDLRDLILKCDEIGDAVEYKDNSAEMVSLSKQIDFD